MVGIGLNPACLWSLGLTVCLVELWEMRDLGDLGIAGAWNSGLQILELQFLEPEASRAGSGTLLGVISGSGSTGVLGGAKWHSSCAHLSLGQPLVLFVPLLLSYPPSFFPLLECEGQS